MSKNTATNSGLENSGAEDRLKGAIAVEGNNPQAPAPSPEAINAYLVIDGRSGGSGESSQNNLNRRPRNRFVSALRR